MDAVVSDNRYIFVNLYALTSDKRNEQCVFGDYIFNCLQKYVGENIVLGGDRNLYLDVAKTNPNLCQNSGYSKQLTSLMDELNLVHIWRVKYADGKRFTRWEKHRFGFSQSRLDFFNFMPS